MRTGSSGPELPLSQDALGAGVTDRDSPAPSTPRIRITPAQVEGIEARNARVVMAKQDLATYVAGITDGHAPSGTVWALEGHELVAQPPGP